MPSADVLGRLAVVLNVSADALLGRAPSKDDQLEIMLQNLAALQIDNPSGFLEALRSLPPPEQQIVARLVRLSALDHTMNRPHAMKGHLNERRAEYKAEKEG
jgi:hypothetical protein